MFGNLKSAWNVLRGLQQVTKQPQSGAKTVRYGSPADAPDEDISVLSASYQFYKNWTHMEPDRLSIYSDMDEMLTYVLASSALEAYVEDATQPDFSTGLTVNPTSPNEEVAAELHKFFENIELEDRISGDIWNLAKYGDYFALLLVDQDKGVFDACPLEPRIVWRHEDSRRVLQGFSIGDASENTDDSQKEVPKYKPWDIVHWRCRSKRVSDPYGIPFFFGIRMIYKVLKLMEEQMVIYRMNMHPDRLVFKVFTGNAGPEDRRRQIRMWRREMERSTSMDKAGGQFRSEYAPWLFNQNIYWPVGQGDQNSGVEKFPGSANAGDIFDVDYMRDLFFAGVRVPKAYMGFEDSQGYRGTDTLSSQSIKFARGVKKLQRYYLRGLTRLCMIHLACRGIDAREPKNQFSLEMSPTSYLDEAHKAELYAKRYEALNYMLDIGGKMKAEIGINSKVWANYILKEFGGWDDNMITQLTSPETGGAPDMNFTPDDTALSFEAQEAEEQKIRNLIGNDKSLSETAATIRKADAAFVRDHSGNMKGNQSPELPAKGTTTNKELFDEAKKNSREYTANQQKKLKEARAKREAELKSLAEGWQDDSK
jgi:hypothetical protein